MFKKGVIYGFFFIDIFKCIHTTSHLHTYTVSVCRFQPLFKITRIIVYFYNYSRNRDAEICLIYENITKVIAGGFLFR